MKRDQIFHYNGKNLLVDTQVLPSLVSSADGGRSWTQGSDSLSYLASRLGMKEATDGLKAAWELFLSDIENQRDEARHWKPSLA